MHKKYVQLLHRLDLESDNHPNPNTSGDEAGPPPSLCDRTGDLCDPFSAPQHSGLMALLGRSPGGPSLASEDGVISGAPLYDVQRGLQGLMLLGIYMA